MSDGRTDNQASLNQSAWQLSTKTLSHIVCLRSVIAFEEVGKKDITKDIKQKDENRLGKGFLSLSKRCQERVISQALC